MIGQKNLIKQLSTDYSTENYPKLSLIVGAEGSGKRTMAHTISKTIIEPSERAPKIDSVRSLIKLAYTIQSPTTYLICDIDKMSEAAQNCLLKVIEEPPNSSAWVLTATDTDNVLSTVKSRARLYRMEPYSCDELNEYLDTIDSTLDNEIRAKLLVICYFPGEIKNFINQCKNSVKDDLNAFYDCVDLVRENIAKVSGANAFKIGTKINFKDDTDKYDLKLFWRAFVLSCYNIVKHQQVPKYIEAIFITKNCLRQLENNALNKQMIFDEWVLEIRRKWI